LEVWKLEMLSEEVPNRKDHQKPLEMSKPTYQNDLSASQLQMILQLVNSKESVKEEEELAK